MTDDNTTTPATMTLAEEQSAARAATFASIAAAIVELDKSSRTALDVPVQHLHSAHCLAGNALMHALFMTDHARAVAFYDQLRGKVQP
jgi:hypothetical protein